MANALGNKTTLGILAETVPGTTPAAALQLITLTGGGPNFGGKTTINSGALGLTEIPDQIMTGDSYTGTITGECSYGMIDTLLEMVMGKAWTVNVLTVGALKKTATIEWQYPDVTKFVSEKGCMITSIALGVGTGNIMTFTANYTALSRTVSGVTVGTGAATAAPTNSIFGPIDQQQGIMEGGANNLLTQGVTGITLEISRSLVPQPGLGQVALFGLDAERFECKGSLTTYYADTILQAKAQAHAITTLSLTFGGAASLKYLFAMTKVYFSGGPGASASGQAIPQNFTYQAVKLDAPSGLTITRTP